MTAKPIYVETQINQPVGEIWSHTQSPGLHQRWDVRFTEITYLDAEHDGPQRFVYATSVAPGLTVDGRGETLGERHRPDGTAYSGLKFWSNHPLSLIKEGAGYWRYVPTPSGVRFLTRYDYRVRWGRFGRAIDRFVFRPAFGWATAWSFDRLRLWLEHGITPERSRNQTLAHLASVVSLAILWLSSGLMLILGPTALPVSADSGLAVNALGIGQVLLGLAMLRWWRRRWTFLLTLLGTPVLTLGVLGGNPADFVRPFNPVAVNVAAMALAGIALVTRHDLPSGKRPLRQAPQDTAADANTDRDRDRDKDRDRDRDRDRDKEGTLR